MFLTKPNISHLKTFGCIYFSLLRPYNSHKLQPHTTSCIFLGYLAYTKGYICLNPITFQIYISRHVLFNEHEFLPSLSLSTSFTTPSMSIRSFFLCQTTVYLPLLISLYLTLQLHLNLDFPLLLIFLPLLLSLMTLYLSLLTLRLSLITMYLSLMPLYLTLLSPYLLLHLFLLSFLLFHKWLLCFRFLLIPIPILWLQGLKLALLSLKHLLLRLVLMSLSQWSGLQSSPSLLLKAQNLITP